MQNNNRDRKSESAKSNVSLSQSASIDVIAGVFATLAEGLGTFATALAYQEAQQKANTTTNNADLQKIQKELQYLTREVKKITKALNL